MKKKSRALIHQPTVKNDIYERYICAHFENGGQDEIIIMRQSVAEVLDVVTALAANLKLDGSNSMDFKLSYWHLNEGLNTLEFSAYDIEIDIQAGGYMRAWHQFLNLRNKVAFTFMHLLAKNNITLIGEKGELA